MAYGRLNDGPPSGWVASGGKLTPAGTIADYAARHQMVRGVCRAQGCNRRIELDPRAMAEVGLGALLMHQVRALWRCSRLEGCGLDFHDERPLNPLSLGQFVGKPNAAVRLSCRGSGCKFFRVWSVEEMIAGLVKRGQGGDRTEIDALGAMMTTACALCKRVNWTAEILWINTDTIGWKQLGERSFGPRHSADQP